MQPWHEDDSFWATWAPDMFSEQAHLRAAAEVEGIVALLQPAEGAPILDLCCGPGRITLPLARLGYRMAGVDRTAAHLETHRALAEAGFDDFEVSGHLSGTHYDHEAKRLVVLARKPEE